VTIATFPVSSPMIASFVLVRPACLPQALTVDREIGHANVATYGAKDIVLKKVTLAHKPNMAFIAFVL
jgi:hypothetical protein